jgi:LruC domain-containing protein
MEQDLQTELESKYQTCLLQNTKRFRSGFNRKLHYSKCKWYRGKSAKCGFILTDSARNLLTERTISIKFTVPVSTSDLGIAPFNPFIIANKERKKEIHLPYAKPTSLGDRFVK